MILSSINFSKGFSFADDTKLIGAISGLKSVELLQEDLNTVIEWSKNNNMELHEKKFEVVNYSVNESKMMKELPFYPETVQYYTPGGVVIAPQDVVRDLGVYMSGDRRWTTQIDKAAQGGRKMAAWVLSAFQDRSTSVMLTLYKSIAALYGTRPILEKYRNWKTSRGHLPGGFWVAKILHTGID